MRCSISGTQGRDAFMAMSDSSPPFSASSPPSLPQKSLSAHAGLLTATVTASRHPAAVVVLSTASQSPPFLPFLRLFRLPFDFPPFSLLPPPHSASSTIRRCRHDFSRPSHAPSNATSLPSTKQRHFLVLDRDGLRLALNSPPLVFTDRVRSNCDHLHPLQTVERLQ